MKHYVRGAHGAMRRAMRTPNNPYRRRERNNDTHATDWVLLAMFVGTCVYLWWPALRLWWVAL